MKIYAISDLHLDYSGEKSMDKFGKEWENHSDKMFFNIKNTVLEKDLILIPGDISWGLKLDDAFNDLKKINDLPGIKILSKGNHDYWWSSKNKLENLDLVNMIFLQTSSVLIEDIGIVATRGWMSRDSEEFNEKDEKVFRRELNRLDLALDSIKNKILEKKIVMIHYPPFNFKDSSPNEFAEIMDKHKVDICIYGHLHGEGHKFSVEGRINNIDYYLVSSDYLEFKPKLIYCRGDKNE